MAFFHLEQRLAEFDELTVFYQHFRNLAFYHRFDFRKELHRLQYADDRIRRHGGADLYEGRRLGVRCAVEGAYDRRRNFDDVLAGLRGFSRSGGRRLDSRHHRLRHGDGDGRAALFQQDLSVLVGQFHLIQGRRFKNSY